MNNLQQTLIDFTGAQRAEKSHRVAHKLSHRLLASLGLCLMLVAGIAQAGPASIDVTYYHNDLLGSPVAATNDQGELIWRKSYKPYGEEIESTADSEEEFVGYTGHRLDKETGLVYAGARYYDPVIGRFMGYDPVGFVEGNPQSFNRYAYGNNNPYKFVDPDGREPYLVSRPLGFTSKANHNFIVTHAEFVGDPNATIKSFGDTGNDTMGRVTGDTKGFSEGTLNTDTKAWQSLSSGENTSVTYRQINALDAAVDVIADRVDTGLEYSAVPKLQGGVNSNTGAGAVAQKSDGGPPRVENGIPQPGSGVTDRLKLISDK